MVKGAVRQVAHSPPSNVEVKDEWWFTSKTFHKIHPVVVYHIKIGVGVAVRSQQVLFTFSINVTCIGHTDHIKAYICIYMYIHDCKTQNKMHIYSQIRVCMHFILRFKIMYLNTWRQSVRPITVSCINKTNTVFCGWRLYRYSPYMPTWRA